MCNISWYTRWKSQVTNATRFKWDMKLMSINTGFPFMIFSFSSYCKVYIHATSYAASNKIIGIHESYTLNQRHITANNFIMLTVVSNHIITSSIHHLIMASDETIHCTCPVYCMQKIKISKYI